MTDTPAEAPKVCVACGPDPTHTNSELWRCERCGALCCILGMHANYRDGFAGHAIGLVKHSLESEGRGSPRYTLSADERILICGPALRVSDEAFGPEEAAERRRREQHALELSQAEQVEAVKKRIMAVHGAICPEDHTDPADPLNPNAPGRKLSS